MSLRRWLPRLAAVAAFTVFVAAGQWQGRRLDEKERLRAQFDAAAAIPPVSLPVLAADESWATWRFRVVRVVGEFDAARQILIDNKVHSGRAGYHVVTPLHLGNDRVVLVDRGWVAPGATRAELPAVPPPAGVVAVTGRINVPPVGYLELAPAAAGPLWQNLDPGRFAAATGLGVLPAVIEETDAPAAANGLIRDWPAPDFGADRHRIYRAQWYAFAALVAGLLGYFELRSLRRKPSPEL